MRVMWNTGAADATGTVVEADRYDVIVRRDDGQHNSGHHYRLSRSQLWAVTVPPYQRKIDWEAAEWFCGECRYMGSGVICTKCGAPRWKALDREYPVVEQHPLNNAIEEAAA